MYYEKKAERYSLERSLATDRIPEGSVQIFPLSYVDSSPGERASSGHARSHTDCNSNASPQTISPGNRELVVKKSGAHQP